MTPKEILLKEPFKRINPDVLGSSWNIYGDDGSLRSVTPSNATYQIVTQDDFLREYDPSGHLVFNRNYLMDRIKTDDKGKQYVHYVERCAFAFQSVITTKRLAHLWGNPIRFINSSPTPTSEQDVSMRELKQGWAKKNMEEGLFACGKSEAITGDTAICFYLNKTKIGYKTFSYQNGEVLYPHYDRFTGKLNLFGRQYKAYGGDGITVVNEYLDVWDDRNITTYQRTNNFKTKVKELIGFDGWTLVGEPKSHGFQEIPIAYKRNSIGACWTLSQDSIDKYELAVSNLSENNKAYAFRILYLKGEQIQNNFDSTGTVNLITGDKDSEAKFLERADASSSFELQLKILRQNIFTNSFSVEPPEVKGGDLPGVTIKLLYSPAVEKAMELGKEWNYFIDDCVRLFKYGYGIEIGRSAQFEALDVRGEIVPYVHQNLMEIQTILNGAVTSGILSKQTAAEFGVYSTNNEFEKIRKEAKEKADAEAEIKSAENATNLARQAAAGKEITPDQV